jgi:hypothetical protein
MYWHHKDVQISVFFDVTPHAVADTYMFQGNPLPQHSGTLTQKRYAGNLLVGGRGGILRAIKIFPNFTEPSPPCSHDAETDRNYIYLTTFFLILKVG